MLQPASPHAFRHIRHATSPPTHPTLSSPRPPLPQVMGPHAQEFIELEQQKSVASLDAKLEAASVKY